MVAGTLSWPPSHFPCSEESPHCSPVLGRRGFNAKINLLTSIGGLCSSVEALSSQSPLTVVQALTLAASTADLQMDLLAADQRTYPSVKTLLASSSLSLQAFPAAASHNLCDISTGTARIVVPSSY